jgi:hypothetical protein
MQVQFVKNWLEDIDQRGTVKVPLCRCCCRKLPLLPWDCRSTALIFAAGPPHHFHTATVLPLQHRRNFAIASRVAACYHALYLLLTIIFPTMLDWTELTTTGQRDEHHCRSINFVLAAASPCWDPLWSHCNFICYQSKLLFHSHGGTPQFITVI